VPPVRLPLEGPVGVAIDAGGSLWIVSAISAEVLQLGPDLAPRGTFTAPYAAEGRHETGGIAYRPGSDTLFLTQPVLGQIWEVEKDGTPTGLVVPLAELEPPPNIIPRTYPKGIDFWPDGHGGAGSLWVVESVLTAVYEVALDGRVLGRFCAPRDPDGCPGSGAATYTSDVKVLYQGTAPVGLEITDGVSRRDRISRVTLDGTPTGRELPLASLGGRLGGFVRGKWRDPRSGARRDALFVTVESSAELHVLEDSAPLLLPPTPVTCDVAASRVRLEWQGFEAYDEIRVRREGELIATLPGTAAAHEDDRPPDGILEYEVVAVKGGCESRTRCQAVVGAGEVIRQAPFGGYQAMGLAEDSAERLWVTDLHNEIHVYSKDLELLGTLPGPFQGEEDATGAIAFDARTGHFHVHNPATNQIVVMDDGGIAVTEPFDAGVPADEDGDTGVTAFLLDPAGASGAGSIWYLDVLEGKLQERTPGGDLLRSCRVPDFAAAPVDREAPYTAYLWGLSTAADGDFASFVLPSGKARDHRATRILRLGAAACDPLGDEIPTAAMKNPWYLSVRATRHDGRAVLYGATATAYRSVIYELETRPPPVPWVRDLTCEQEGELPAARLSFRAPPGIDAILVERDGAPIAEVPPAAVTYLDAGAGPGLHVYRLRARTGTAVSDDRACEVLLGPGAIARRAFSHPVSFLHSIARDPVDGSYVAASNLNRLAEEMHRFDAALRFVESMPGPYAPPSQIAALAVRAAGGAGEIYCLGWNPGAAPGTQPTLPLVVTDRGGRRLRQHTVVPPRPRGNFVAFPAGMAWDAATDTLWYLERNAFRVVNMTLEGDTIASFAHPAELNQDGVFNYGLAIDAGRGALYLTGAGPLDHEITKLVEVTRQGDLTGVEIPLRDPVYARHWAVSAAGAASNLLVSANAGGVWDLVEVRAFGPAPPVAGLSCQPDRASVRLAWAADPAHEAILVYRGADLAVTLPAGAASWTDETPGPVRFYRVAGAQGGLAGPGTICTPGSLFVRGEVEVNGDVNITDAVAILGYLFLGSAAPRCLDAADVNDSGRIDITDAVLLLGYLFAAGPPPAPPFPAPGPDATADDLTCND
jgi:hypothetical protein